MAFLNNPVLPQLLLRRCLHGPKAAPLAAHLSYPDFAN
jgi:hypothetical protein